MDYETYLTKAWPIQQGSFKKWLPIRVFSTLGRNSNIRHCYEGQSLVGRCIEECKFNVKSAMNPRSCKLTAHFTAGWQVLF